MNEKISVETANSATDSLVKEIHKLQEPKTPTQEQIEIIYNGSELRGDIPRSVILIIITEWEKIRNN